MKIKLLKKNIDSLQPKQKAFEVNDTEIKGFLLRVQPTGNKTFYLSYYNNAGKRERYKIGSYGTITATQAREAAERYAGQIANGNDIQQEKKRNKSDAINRRLKTLKIFIDERYEIWRKQNNKSAENAIKGIKTNFIHLMNYELDEIDDLIIEKWRQEKIKSGSKFNSINRQVSDLRSLLSRAVEWKIIQYHPLEKLKPLKNDGNKVIRYLDHNERARLFEALDKRETRIKAARKSANEWRKNRNYETHNEISEDAFADYLKPMVIISLNTGLRRGELFNLDWNDIDSVNKLLIVQAEVAKSGKTRYVNLNQHALEALTLWKKYNYSSGLIFKGKDGKRFNNINKAWKKLIEDANINKFRWHDLRHEFASKLVMAGVDLNTVRELLGHSDIKMTLRYAHLSPEHKSAAVNKLNNL